MPLAVPPSSSPSSPVLDIVCLCAAWCGTCREYGPVFDELMAALPGHRYRWIDIEDEADLIGDIDVETFPTLLVAHRGAVLFAGPVLPRLGDARRLVEVQQAQARAGRWPSSKSLGLPEDQVEAFGALAKAVATKG